MPVFLKSRTILAAVCGAALALNVGCSKEDAAFQEAQTSNSIDAYESFLKEFPDNNNQMTIEERLDELYYEKAKADNTEEAYKAYLQRFPKGKHTSQVNGEYEKLAYKSASKDGSAKALEAFLSTFPSGNYAKKAAERLETYKYFAKLSVSDVKVEKINMAGDKRGEPDGWEITGTVTNTGERGVDKLALTAGPKGGPAGEVESGALAPGGSVTFAVKTEKAPEGWDETTVAVDFKALSFSAEAK